MDTNLRHLKELTGTLIGLLMDARLRVAAVRRIVHTQELLLRAVLVLDKKHKRGRSNSQS